MFNLLLLLMVMVILSNELFHTSCGHIQASLPPPLDPLFFANS